MADERKYHLHVENSRASPPVFHITPELFADACRRHPHVADRLAPTFGWDCDGFVETIRTADFLVGFRFPVDVIASRGAPKLRWIHLTGAGIEHVLPLSWLPAGTVLTNNRGVHAEKAGEFIAMAVLALNNRLPFYQTSKSLRRWDRVFVSSVRGKTAAILGVGNMGGAGAERCKALGLRVLGIARTRRDHPHVDEMFGPDDLAAVLPRADFLVVTVPQTAGTRGLIGKKALDLLRREAGIVNMARAGVMDYGALADSLRQGKLSGAVLDVFDPEPLSPESFLWDVPNLIITPHVSSDDAEKYIPDTLDLFFRNFENLLAGTDLHNRVDTAREY